MRGMEPHEPQVGDIVSRDGSDEQVIVACWPEDEPREVLSIKVRCIKAPTSGWCAVGEEEDNLPGRYILLRRPGIVPNSDPPAPESPAEASA